MVPFLVPSRYHPACVGMTIEDAKKLDHFVCSECSSDDTKRPHNGFSSSPEADGKVRCSYLQFHIIENYGFVACWLCHSLYA